MRATEGLSVEFSINRRLLNHQLESEAIEKILLKCLFMDKPLKAQSLKSKKVKWKTQVNKELKLLKTNGKAE